MTEKAGGTALMDGNRLVALRTGLEGADAQLLRSLLESKGLQVFLVNESAVSGMTGHAVSVDLYVRAVDKPKADAILGNVVTLPRAMQPHRFDEDGEELSCHHCGSTRVHPYEGKVPTLIPGLKLQSGKNERWYHCLQCDSYYEEGRKRFSGWPIAVMWAAVLGLASLGLMWVINFLRFL
ncbi:putative signal transducing protein [Kordiimonas marina]|uniref:putative signal transducing protein n=1 Tax=Kordiimonas marina TaxID=2872312 RepID=UPI001FF54F92|nr:DUF2007 domain-containing protein [Kordiimonas marina]MCJ9427662.1 DUF2007 domain-containing protein [Kordiimonas marina]